MTSILAMGHPYQRDKSPLQEKVTNVLLNIKKAWSRFTCLSNLRATTPFNTISTNDPRPDWDVSVRLTLVLIESGSFRFENKRRISKIPVAPNHSVRGYVNCNIDYSRRKKIFRNLLTFVFRRFIFYSAQVCSFTLDDVFGTLLCL